MLKKQKNINKYIHNLNEFAPGIILGIINDPDLPNLEHYNKMDEIVEEISSIFKNSKEPSL